MPGGALSGPFRNLTPPPSSRSSRRGSAAPSLSGRSAPSVRDSASSVPRSRGSAPSVGGRSARSSSAASLGGSSQGGGARAALRAALSATELRDVAGKLGQEASQRHGSLSKALKSVKTDNRGGVTRTEMRSLCDEYGVARKQSDRLFDTLDTGGEGTINLTDFSEVVSQNVQFRPMLGEEDAPSARKAAGPQSSRSASRSEPPNSRKDSEASSIASLAGVYQTAYQQTAQQMAQAEKARSQEAVAVALAAEKERILAAADKNGDGKLSLAELKAVEAQQKMAEAAFQTREEEVETHAEHEVATAVDRLATTVARNFDSLQQAYLVIKKTGPCDRQKGISRNKIRAYMSCHGYGTEISDRVFDRMNKNGTHISFNEFQTIFGPYLQPSHSQAQGGLHGAGKKDRSIQVGKGAKIKDKNLLRLIETMGNSVRSRYNNMHDCFRTINNDNGETLTRDEVREFFSRFAYDEKASDQVFDHLDRKGLGELSRNDFGAILAPYMVKGYEPETRTNGPQAHGHDAKRMRTPAKIQDRDLALAVKKVGQAVGVKFNSVLKAFRSIDDDKDGMVQRTEVHKFFRDYGYDEEMGDKFFDLVNTDGSQELDYREFQSHFGPYIYGWSTLGEEEQRLDIQKGHYDQSDKLMGHHSTVENITPVITPVQSEAGGKSRRASDAGNTPRVRPPLPQKEVEDIFHHVATITARNKKGVREAFTALKHGGQGWSSTAKGKSSQRVGLKQFTDYMKCFGYDEWTGEQVFRYMDLDNSGSFDYPEFQQLFGEYLRPSWQVEQKPPRDALPPAKPVTDKHLRKVIDKLGQAVGAKYRRTADLVKHNTTSGTLNKDEVREFFDRFNFSKTDADAFYSNMHLDVDGDCDYREFVSHFTPYITQSCTEKHQEADPYGADLRPRQRPLKVGDPELENVLQGLGDNVAQRFGTVRKAWRQIDQDKDGFVCKDEMRGFFKELGYKSKHADQFFDAVDATGGGTLDYHEFQHVFAPYICGHSQLGHEEERISAQKNHYDNHEKSRCKKTGRKLSSREEYVPAGCRKASSSQDDASSLRSASAPASARYVKSGEGLLYQKGGDPYRKVSERTLELIDGTRQSANRERVSNEQSDCAGGRWSEVNVHGQSHVGGKHPRTKNSDSDLSRAVRDVCDKMKSKHGERPEKAFKYLAAENSDYVTRKDCHTFLRNYGYAGLSDDLFDRLDGQGTGGLCIKSFQGLFEKEMGNSNGARSGQTSYRSAFGS